MAEYSQKWHNGTFRTRSTKTSDGLAAIQAQLNNLKREIKKINEKERGFGSLPSSTEINPRDHVKSISTTVEADMSPIRRIGSPQYVVLAQQNRKLIFKSRQMIIPFTSRLNNYYYDDKGSYGPQYLDTCSYGATCLNDALPQKENDPRSFTLPYYINNVCFKNALADLGASVSVMPLSTYLNLGIGKFIFLVDFIILDMPEDVKVPLTLGRPFLSTAHAKIDASKRNQVDDLMPTIKEGEVVDKPMIEEVKTRNDNKMVRKIIGYPSDYDQDEKILVEDMDPYLDEGMGEVVVGEPF
ncbi:hypothetical protein Tco_1011899 [Tanacetum coccineum]